LIGKRGQAEEDRQKRTRKIKTGRRGQAEDNRQNRTDKQDEQDSQNKTARIGQLE
jgi:hypothetical protein